VNPFGFWSPPEALRPGPVPFGEIARDVFSPEAPPPRARSQRRRALGFALRASPTSALGPCPETEPPVGDFLAPSVFLSSRNSRHPGFLSRGSPEARCLAPPPQSGFLFLCCSFVSACSAGLRRCVVAFQPCQGSSRPPPVQFPFGVALGLAAVAPLASAPPCAGQIRRFDAGGVPGSPPC
jgi:hypothetical protein